MLCVVSCPFNSFYILTRLSQLPDILKLYNPIYWSVTLTTITSVLLVNSMLHANSLAVLVGMSLFGVARSFGGGGSGGGGGTGGGCKRWAGMSQCFLSNSSIIVCNSSVCVSEI